MTAFTPHRYQLRIRPDLETFTFAGRVTIHGALAEPADAVRLHARDLEVEACVLEAGDMTSPCAVATDGDDGLRVALPRPVVGPITLSLTYRGTINDAMAGFYRSRYRAGGAEGTLALTQFQESDARRALPCVDHPAAKAVFEVEFEIDAALTAIANTPVAEELATAGGRKRVRFEPTPKMSSYLLFFAVGPFTLSTDTVDPRVRAATLPGAATQAGFGLAFGRESLRFCEAYYRVPYPLAKMDLIAVPDFAFGAMENWGAITFRENLLLRVPGVTSRLGEERICEVIAHEVAHQWFGNLVTPAEWQYLWLNESFATYFSYKVLDDRHPEWKVWQQFLLGQTEVALERDELRGTFAIEMPGGGERKVAITESTAPIIYSKGGSILRQVEGYIGAAGFRDGLTRYLRRHAYANAASHHLWDALGEAADKPVLELMRGWVEQPGHPVVEASRDGDRLRLSQRRFTLLPGEDPHRWQVPVRVHAFRDGSEVVLRELLLTEEHGELTLPPGTVAYKVNAEQTGFYRVAYADPADRAALGPRVRGGELSPVDRWGLASDLYALAVAGRAGVGEYLEFLAWYDREDELLPLASIARGLRHLHRVLPGDRAGSVAATGARLLQGCLDRIGYAPRDGEAHTTSVLRDQILWDAAVFGAPRALAAGREAFDRLQQGEEVAADVVKAALQIGAWTADPGDERLEWLQQRFATTESEHGRVNVVTALGAWRDPRTLTAALRFTLDRVPDRLRFVPLVAAAANPAAGPHLWGWFEEHIGALEGFHPMLFERVFAAVVPIAGLPDPDHARDFVAGYVARRPHVAEVAGLALEKLEINARLRAA